MSYFLVIDALAKSGNFCEALESEHELIELIIETLDKAIAAHTDRTTILHLIDMLDDECRSHFVKEEEYMTESHATDIGNHVLSHRHLADRTARVRSSIQNNEPSGIPDAIDLLHCIQAHITGVDQPAYERLRPGGLQGKLARSIN